MTCCCCCCDDRDQDEVMSAHALLVDLVDELRGAGRGETAMQIERCFRLGRSEIDARSAILILAQGATQ